MVLPDFWADWHEKVCSFPLPAVEEEEGAGLQANGSAAAGGHGGSACRDEQHLIEDSEGSRKGNEDPLLAEGTAAMLPALRGRRLLFIRDEAGANASPASSEPHAGAGSGSSESARRAAVALPSLLPPAVPATTVVRKRVGGGFINVTVAVAKLKSGGRLSKEAAEKEGEG